eukprot:gene7972-15212_t
MHPAIPLARDGHGAGKVAAAPDRLLKSEAESPAVFVGTVAKAALLGAANGGRGSAAGAVMAAKAAVGVGVAFVAPDAAAGTVDGGVFEESEVSIAVAVAVAVTGSSGGSELSIDGDLWLQSASGVETFFDNAWHSNVDGSLKLVNSSNTTDTPYEDQIGSYDLTTFTWESTTNADAATPTTVVTSFRLYDQFTATAVMKGKLPTLGSLSWSKTFLEGLSEGVGAPEPQADNESPTVLFKAHNGTTAVISPVNHFMTMSQASTASAWHYGVGSEVTSLPTGFVFQTLFYASGAGITAGVDAWGGAMKAVHNFTAKMPDTRLTQLGYMTDRGGYYYWYANPPDLHKSSQVGLPERKFKELAAHFHSVSLPVKYYQLDAYWYACDGWNACIEDFAPHPGYFPNGLAALSKTLGAPLNLYHNYFCPKNNYTALGFDFVSGGIPITSCMSTPRYILESLKNNAATAARASVDYAQDGGGNVLRFGYVTSLFWALGLAPSKDTFWSVGPTQPADGTYVPHQTARHPNPELHTIVAGMSMGPVDVELVMRTCMANGTLLRPTRPIAASDVGFALDRSKRQGTGQSVNNGKVWRTMSLVHDGCDFYVWHYVLGFKLSKPYQVTLADLAPPPGIRAANPYEGENFLYPGNGTAKGGTDFLELSVLIPMLSNGFAVLGEANKYVAASPDRFKFITLNPNSTMLTVVGAPNETVQITSLVPVNGSATTMKVVVVDVLIPSSGTEIVTISA